MLHTNFNDNSRPGGPICQEYIRLHNTDTYLYFYSDAMIMGDLIYETLLLLPLEAVLFYLEAPIMTIFGETFYRSLECLGLIFKEKTDPQQRV